MLSFKTLLPKMMCMHEFALATRWLLSKVATLYQDVTSKFLKMSANQFRKEYLRKRQISKEDAKRKQIKMRSQKSDSCKKIRIIRETHVSTAIPSTQSPAFPCGKCNIECGDDCVICCDRCDKWYHFACVKMSSRKVPKAEWFCYKCNQ